MLKSTSVIIAVLLSTAAYAEGDDGSLVTRGTSGVVIGTPAMPYIMPFVSDRTARRLRPIKNWQPGPFHEGNAK